MTYHNLISSKYKYKETEMRLVSKTHNNVNVMRNWKLLNFNYENFIINV